MAAAPTASDIRAKPPPEVAAHGARAGVGGADNHVGDADLVLDLANHDAEVARVLGVPVEHAGGRAHGVGGVELHAGRGAAHGEGLIAGPHCLGLAAFRHGVGEGDEVLLGVGVAREGHAHVLVHHILALSSELLSDARFED